MSDGKLRALIEELRAPWTHYDGKREILCCRAADELERLTAAGSHLSASSNEGWRDIASAPRDGTNILLLFPGPFRDPTETGACVGMWTGSDWWCRAIWASSTGRRDPTHWRPLPPPPSPGEEQ